MAECLRFVCDHCQHERAAWGDGNPYYLDAAGRKRYAYHPDHGNLAKCIGNDSPYLCLACGATFKVDSRAPKLRCDQCDSPDVCDCFQLEGRGCPACHTGVFRIDPNYRVVS